MPFSGQGRIYGLQAVILACGPSGAVRTPSATVAIGYRGFPLMATATDPPGFLIRVWSDIQWSQISILFRMPLLDQLRVNGLQVAIRA